MTLVDDNLIWEARKEKDKLLKNYALEEVKKLVYVLIGSDNIKCIEDSESLKMKDFPAHIRITA